MKRTTGLSIMTLAAIILIAGGGSAQAGHTADQLSDAGFTCFPAGPYLWIHCLNFDKLVKGQPAIPVKVFSVSGDEFFGTEQLLRSDLYSKSRHPCPQDDLDEWSLDPDIPYFACHHFSTGHH